MHCTVLPYVLTLTVLQPLNRSPTNTAQQGMQKCKLNVVVLEEGGRGLASIVYTSNKGYGTLTHSLLVPSTGTCQRVTSVSCVYETLTIQNHKSEEKKLLVYASMKCCCVLVTTVSRVHTHEAHTRQFRERERERKEEKEILLSLHHILHTLAVRS